MEHPTPPRITGFTLTARPLVKAGLATSVVVSTALAAHTLFAITAAAAVVMALLASYIPVRRLASLDPAAVFRA